MKNKTAKRQRLNIFTLYKQTFREWLKNFNSYTKIVLVVAIPVAILTVLQADGNTGDFGLTMAFAWSFTSIALILLASNGKTPLKEKISTLYSAAGGRFLQYIGVSLVLILMATPGLAGWLGIVSALGGSGTSALYLIIAGLAGIIISIYLLVRFNIAQVITVAESKSVMQSLKSSFKLSKRHFWGMLAGYVIILLGVFLLANGVQLLLSIRQSINENIYINNLVYVVEATIFLPIIYIYQLKLLRALNGEG
jgi:hypothetical protein